MAKRSWKDDDPKLIELWNAVGPTIEGIAAAIKRSNGGIRYRVFYLRQHGVELRDRKGGYLPGQAEAAAAKRAEERPAMRACNLCEKPWQPENKFQRFCPTCRRNERMSNIGRTDANWGVF